MAIYQYHIELIPRQSIIRKSGKIPKSIVIDHDSSKDMDGAVTENWWDERQILFADIEPYIDSFAKPVEWLKDSKDLKSYGDTATNDFTIGLKDFMYIEELDCRIDLRELNLNFINHVLEIAQKLDCLLFDKKGNLFEPTLPELIENIKQSNSFMFVTSPFDFLDKLSTGQIKPE